MKKISIVIFLSVLLALPALTAQANEPLDVKLARVLSYQKKYDESLKYYNRYIGSHPKDYAVILEAADVAFWNNDQTGALVLYLRAAESEKLAATAYSQAGFMELILGDFKSAAKYLNLSLELRPDDEKTRTMLAQVLSYDGKFADSVAEYNRVLANNPSNPEALAQKADVLSWDMKYAEAIDTYEKRLAISFDWEIARQKARVLGWWKKYQRALSSYEDTYEKSKREEVSLELSGKKAYWNKWVRTAIKRYQNLLEIEPKNIEARFDLAQTKAYQGLWTSANEDFNLVLKQYSGHFRAADSIAKLSQQTRPYVRPEINYFRAKSGEFETYINELSSGLSVGEAFNENFELFASYFFDYFHYESASSIQRNRGRIGFGASSPMNIGVNASFIPIDYLDSDRFSANFDASVYSRPFDPIYVKAFAKRSDLTQNRWVIDNKLRTTDAGGLISADINRRWTAMADGSRSWLSDSNGKNAFGVENLVFLNYEPKRLTLDVRFDYYGYDFTAPNYWSPSKFWNASATLHWRHYLNDHDLYYGALDTYYGLKYRFAVDKNNNAYNGGSFELHHDFNHKSSINLEVNGSYARVYDDFGANITFTQRF